MKNLKTVALLIAFALVVVSCKKDENVREQQTSNVKNENQNTTQRFLSWGIIVRNWGSHNIDCSQPNGFCYDVWTITYHDLLLAPLDGNTPAVVENVDGKFVVKINKTALTKQNAAALLRNGTMYKIPEGQDIKPALMENLGFKSGFLKPGAYKIVDSDTAYTISIDVLL